MGAYIFLWELFHITWYRTYIKSTILLYTLAYIIRSCYEINVVLHPLSPAILDQVMMLSTLPMSKVSKVYT